MSNNISNNYKEVIVLLPNGSEAPYPNVTIVIPSVEKIELTQEFDGNKVHTTLFTKNIAGYSVW